MAEERTLVDYVTPAGITVASKADTANWQYLAVQIHNAGVMLADARSEGTPYILAYKTNSGEHASLVGVPNISKAIAAGAILRGNPLKPTSATGLVGVTSAADPLCFATAWTTAAGSGVVFSIKLGK